MYNAARNIFSKKGEKRKCFFVEFSIFFFKNLFLFALWLLVSLEQILLITWNCKSILFELKTSNFGKQILYDQSQYKLFDYQIQIVAKISYNFVLCKGVHQNKIYNRRYKMQVGFFLSEFFLVLRYLRTLNQSWDK